MSDSTYDHFFRSSRDSEVFSEDAHLNAMLRVEAALAVVEAKLGIIPTEAAEAIATCCALEKIDKAALARAGAAAGNLAIPLVKQLTVAVRKVSTEAARYVHWGATSQDILDTALVLQLRSHIDFITEAIENICKALVELIDKHRNTVMAGRTWLQHAVPTTFGLVAAGWLDVLLRHRERLAEMRPRVLVLQFGGAAGTLASLGNDGLRVAEALAREMDLSLPAVPWHSHRDRVAEIAAFHGLLVGSIGKIARDLSLGMQAEVGEFAESSNEGQGVSSTMPQKRNPVTCAVILSTAIRVPGLVSTMLSAMVQEQQRGLGGWQSEWETLPEICMLTLGALEKLESMLVNLEVFPDVMQRNLSLTNGLISAEAVSMEIAKHLGRDEAHQLVQAASREVIAGRGSLRAVLEQTEAVTTHLNSSDLSALTDPTNYLGSSMKMIDSVLVNFRRAFPSCEEK